MAEIQQVNIHCECYHRRGLLYVLRPWAWDRPCRRCRCMMDRNVVVVPTSGAAVSVNPCMTRPSPVVVTTTSQSMAPQTQMVTVTPAQTAADWQATQQAYPSTLPPRYEMVATK
ncbi:uncharacterized protein LOC117780092 [Drosophila innubila]|uniref:uncharacterized protein LOC117780092 n=1 Tax=Drosophila innubila TaxID=198719 RepID=UPI00148C6B63|nr:uncharacterized protein LOC117780092 [Drosophila innubila]